jgi:cytochrome c oxidase subunit IV
LRVISIVLQIFSFLIFAAGLISAIFIFTSLDSVWQLGIVVLVIAISNSLLLLAIAELVIVLADISISTRATLNQVIDVIAIKVEKENKQ